MARVTRFRHRPTSAIGTGTDRRVVAIRRTAIRPWATRPRAPLYDERFEHDACGVGFVAESRLGHTARVLPLALEGLARLTHRGAIAADAKTGDGAGVTLPLSPSLRHRIAP